MYLTVVKNFLKKIVYAYLFIQIKDFEEHYSAIRENGEVLEVSPWLSIQSLLFFFFSCES